VIDRRDTRATRNSYYYCSCKLRVTEKPCEFTAESGVPRNISKNISAERATRATSFARALQLPECPCATWSFDKALVGT